MQVLRRPGCLALLFCHDLSAHASAAATQTRAGAAQTPASAVAGMFEP